MITIIDTGVGNFRSIKNMLARLQVPAIISADPQQIALSNKIILPGVGSFDSGMKALQSAGIDNVIIEKSKDKSVKILGICLGMQMLSNASEEGCLPGLGIIPGKVKKMQVSRSIPHMGWNFVLPQKDSPLFSSFTNVPRFYFTHSYVFECEHEENVLTTTPYGKDFTSAIMKDQNIYGVQFHPEKSHQFGLQLLENFAKC